MMFKRSDGLAHPAGLLVLLDFEVIRFSCTKGRLRRNDELAHSVMFEVIEYSTAHQLPSEKFFSI